MNISKKTLYDLCRIEFILNRQLVNKYAFVSNRLQWLLQYKKAPQNILYAFIDKATATFEGVWYGDEKEQKIINDFLNLARQEVS